MRINARNQIAQCLAGIISLVVMPALALAQYTAPLPTPPAKSEKAFAMNQPVVRAKYEVDQSIQIVKVKEGNPDHLEAGFYATIKPKTYDTVYVYEGGTEQFTVIGVHSGKEIIHGDSLSVANDVSFRMNHFDESGIPVSSEKKAKTSSIIIRSGSIPAQGFGSQRFRFAVKPSNFTLSESSMISASVHMSDANNIGNVMCAVTKIDCHKGIFFVETSNEIPLGENINWIIVNTP